MAQISLSLQRFLLHLERFSVPDNHAIVDLLRDNRILFIDAASIELRQRSH